MILENGYKYAMNCMTHIKQCSYKCTDGNTRLALINDSTNYTNLALYGFFALAKAGYTDSYYTNYLYNYLIDYFDKPCTYEYVNNNTNNRTYIQNILGMWVGTGTTQPTFTDYQMENALPLTDMGLASKTRYFNTDKYIELAYTFKNITDHDITVTELGIYTFGGYTSTESYWNAEKKYKIYPVLLARKIIDPVKVGAGFYATFNYRINLGLSTT